MREENLYSKHSDLNFITRSCENRFFSITLLKSPTTFEQRNYQFERCNNSITASAILNEMQFNSNSLKGVQKS